MVLGPTSQQLFHSSKTAPQSDRREGGLSEVEMRVALDPTTNGQVAY